MISLVTAFIFSSGFNLSAINSHNIKDSTANDESHHSSCVLDDYYKEFEHSMNHGKKCTCSSSQALPQDTLKTYYSEFLNTP